LYLDYFTGSLNESQNISKVIEKAGLGYESENIVNADILYLLNKGLIQGISVLGRPIPMSINIAPSGIDYIEPRIEKLITVMGSSKEVIHQNIKQIIDGAASEEEKLSRLRSVFSNYPDLFDKFL
jgi:hypothetical protein